MRDDDEEDRRLFWLTIALVLFALVTGLARILVAHNDEVNKREAIVNAIEGLKVGR